MNIKDYEYVLEAAKWGNLSKAAEKLCITQGALTKYLQRLDRELGTPLFSRNGSRFVPTAAGELYLTKARQIIDLDHELAEEIARLGDQREAAVRFGYPMGMHAFVMEYLLPAFFEKHEKASLSLKEEGSGALVQLVEEGKLDLCLAYLSENRGGLECLELARTCIVLAVPADSPLVRLGRECEGCMYPLLQDDRWLNEPFVDVAPHTRSGKIGERYFALSGRTPQIRLYVNDTRSALAAVEQGLGNCLLYAIPHTDKRVRYLCVPGLDEVQRVCLVYRRGEAMSRSFSGLVRLCRECYEGF